MTPTEALELYRRAGLHELGRQAHQACCAKHPQPWRTYVIDRNVNYTNVCRARCGFCAFSVDAPSERAYVLPADALLEKVAQLVQAGGTQVLLQGGMNESLSFDDHLRMLRAVRAAFPTVQLHAFSPPEIWFFHEQLRRPLEWIIEQLVSAGLGSVPGGGAEILVDRVRAIVSPKKCSAGQWLEVMRVAHRLGLRTTATMMFGHAERDDERIEHLQRLRELQDESLAAGRGRFTAFACWTYQPRHTPLSQTSVPLHLAGAVAYLRTLAIARLYLDNFENLQASWVTQGPKVGQLSLFYGANDMGGVMMEENVVAAAGTSFRMSVAEMRRLIADAGYQPRQRTGLYEWVEA